MKLSNYLVAIGLVVGLASCQHKTKNTVPVVGFVDALQDETLAQARIGFVAALKDSGFSEDKKTVKIEYRNAQNDQPTLGLIVNYFVSQPVDLLATCTTLSSLTAVQKTKTIPIFEMVSPTPARMNVLDAKGNPPANLFGAVEDLQYIDTSFAIIPKVIKPKAGKSLTIGMTYNQSEPQSVDALARIKGLAAKTGITLVALPLNTSADAQLTTQSLLSKNIDVFFALPDNTVFAAFETIKKNCDQHNVPVFTSEAGLVKLGAVAAYGADMYQWGYQAGEQAAHYLKTHSTAGLKPEMVKIRKRVYNPDAAKKFGITIPADFQPLK
jgi:putative tryptophan/tyrosine transport system substrate-binding protein